MNEHTEGSSPLEGHSIEPIELDLAVEPEFGVQKT